jgi:hypothetical protein
MEAIINGGIIPSQLAAIMEQWQASPLELEGLCQELALQWGLDSAMYGKERIRALHLLQTQSIRAMEAKMLIHQVASFTILQGDRAKIMEGVDQDMEEVDQGMELHHTEVLHMEEMNK